MNLQTYLIERISEDKSLIEELLFVDNKVQYTNLTYENVLELLKKDNEYDILDDDLNSIAITDGELNTVIKMIISVPNLSTIYVNRTFLGINKYLIKCVNELYGYEKIKLDETEDYQKYFNSANRIVLSGFDTFVEELAKEFNNEVVVL